MIGSPASRLTLLRPSMRGRAAGSSDSDGRQRVMVKCSQCRGIGAFSEKCQILAQSFTPVLVHGAATRGSHCLCAGLSAALSAPLPSSKPLTSVLSNTERLLSDNGIFILWLFCVWLHNQEGDRAVPIPRCWTHKRLPAGRPHTEPSPSRKSTNNV